MGTYIVTGILFIFFMGVIGLIMDSLTTKHKQDYTTRNTDHTPATVILDENHNIDLDKFNS